MAEKRGMAGWMQWAIFLGIAALSGLLWFPLGGFVNSQFFEHDPLAGESLWLWLPITGLLTGLVYRIFTRWRDGQEPSAWWLAALVPSLAVFACVCTLTMRGVDGAQPADFILCLIVGNIAAYITMGWLIIPLAIPYVMLIGWLHRETIRLGGLATRRHVRQVVWGFASLGFLGATEAPRMRGHLAQTAYYEAAAYIPVQLPVGTELLPSAQQDDLGGVRRFWFRSAVPLEWPLVADQQPLSNPDDRESMEYRALKAGIKTDASTTYNQAKWIHDDRTVQITRVRTKGVDYLELIRW